MHQDTVLLPFRSIMICHRWSPYNPYIPRQTEDASKAAHWCEAVTGEEELPMSEWRKNDKSINDPRHAKEATDMAKLVEFPWVVTSGMTERNSIVFKG